MSSFFLKSKSTSKRKSSDKAKVGAKKKVPKGKQKAAENYIDSDSDILSDKDDGKEAYESDSSIEETAQEKRLRLAKEYLAKLEKEEGNKDLENAVDRDAVAHRLQEDVLEQRGKLQRKIADQYSAPHKESIRILRGHQLSITCLVISNDDRHIYSGSKDGNIIKWNFETGQKVGKIPLVPKSADESIKGHRGHVLCLAISNNGKYLASGGHDKLVYIWNPETLDWIHTFRGHRGTVSGLTFRKNTHQLFSSSCDRCVKVWNLDEMAYVETLFGHEDEITGIDSLVRDRAVTSGGRDRSVRLWKIPEESQLVFRATRYPQSYQVILAGTLTGYKVTFDAKFWRPFPGDFDGSAHRGTSGSSIDCVSMINEDHIITGADDGSISVWNVHKKKPVTTVMDAHSSKNDDSENIDTCKECWITAVTAMKNSDLLATGSCDSCIRLWKCESWYKSVNPLFAVPMVGFVNSLTFSNSGDFLIAGIGQEHRLGRWWRLKSARNSICIIPLPRLKENGS